MIEEVSPPILFLRPNIVELRLLLLSDVESAFFLCGKAIVWLKEVEGRTIGESFSLSASGIVGGRFGRRRAAPAGGGPPALSLLKNDPRFLAVPLRSLASARARAFGSSRSRSPTADIVPFNPHLAVYERYTGGL